MCRYEQMKEMQRFINERTFQNPGYNPERDLVVLAGDFN